MRKYFMLVSLVVIGVLALAGCGSVSAGNPKVTLTTNPNPPTSNGTTEVIIQVKDANGQPLDGVSVVVHGDHTQMKGMLVQDTATALGNGRYVVKTRLGMAGKWKLSAQVTMPNMPTLASDYDVEVK